MNKHRFLECVSLKKNVFGVLEVHYTMRKIVQFSYIVTTTNKKLSCCKETVRLLRVSVLAKYNWKTIFRSNEVVMSLCDQLL